MDKKSLTLVRYISARVARMVGAKVQLFCYCQVFFCTFSRFLLDFTDVMGVKVNDTKASLGYDLNLINNPSYAESIALVINSETNAFTTSPDSFL